MAGSLRADLFTLNDGHKIPAVGLGTFQGNYDYKSTFDTVKSACESAIEIGYRHFDTAAIYQTEEGLGAAVNQKIKEGVIKREDVFITTKLWSPHHRTENVVPALKKSLSILKLDYVDMFLIHWPIAIQPSEEIWPVDAEGNVLYEDDRTPNTDTWKGMEECKRLGLAKSIGISNFNKRQTEEILASCQVKPSNLQLENHPFFQNQRMLDLCQEHGILMTGFSPLGKPQRDWAKDGDPGVFIDPTLAAIGKKYNKSSAQIALKYQVQRGVAVVPKSITPRNQKDNLNIFDFDLSEEDMAAIKALDKNFRVLYLDRLRGSKEYPYDEEY